MLDWLSTMTRKKLLVAIKRVIDYNAKVRVKSGAVDLSNVKARCSQSVLPQHMEPLPRITAALW